MSEVVGKDPIEAECVCIHVCLCFPTWLNSADFFFCTEAHICKQFMIPRLVPPLSFVLSNNVSKATIIVVTIHGCLGNICG